MALIAAHLNAEVILVVTVYIISLYTHLHTPFSATFSPSLISIMVSVDVKHHVYLLKNRRLAVYKPDGRRIGSGLGFPFSSKAAVYGHSLFLFLFFCLFVLFFDI